MSVKNNLNFIKNEFSSDEKIIENAFKLEILYKRYRHIILGVLIGIVALVAFLSIKYYVTESNAKKSSEILQSLLENPKDEALRSSLQKNNAPLYNLFLLQQSLESGNVADLETLSNQQDLVQFLANYHLGSFERDSAILNKSEKYALGDFAKIQEAYILLKNGKANEAKNILSSISQDSPLSEIATILSHSSIKLYKAEAK